MPLKGNGDQPESSPMPRSYAPYSSDCEQSDWDNTLFRQRGVGSLTYRISVSNNLTLKIGKDIVSCPPRLTNEKIRGLEA